MHFYSSLHQNIVQLIQQQKGIRASRLLTKSFEQLGFDLVDLIDTFLAVEEKYQITIPDEVPLNSVSDFVSFIQIKNNAEPISAWVKLVFVTCAKPFSLRKRIIIYEKNI